MRCRWRSERSESNSHSIFIFGSGVSTSTARYRPRGRESTAAPTSACAVLSKTGRQNERIVHGRHLAAGAELLRKTKQGYPVRSNNSSTPSCPVQCLRLMEFGTRTGHYSSQVRRLPGGTTADQNRSWHTALRTPDATISTHQPDLSHNHVVSRVPSILPSKNSLGCLRSDPDLRRRGRRSWRGSSFDGGGRARGPMHRVTDKTKE